MFILDHRHLRELLRQFPDDARIAVKFQRGEPPRYGYRYSVDSLKFERGTGGIPLITFIAAPDKVT